MDMDVIEVRRRYVERARDVVGVPDNAKGLDSLI